MTPEDYLRYSEQENKRLFDLEMLNIGEAYKALKMAREEERKKAIEAFDEVTSEMVYHISRGEPYDCYINKFKELLKK